METFTHPSEDRSEHGEEMRSGPPAVGELENSSHSLSTAGIPQYRTPYAGKADMEEGEKLKLVVEPFQSVIETLTKLEKEDAKAAAQGARLVSLLRRLWESCVTKHIDSQRLEEGNQQLRAMNSQLHHEGNHLQHTHDDQLAHFHAVEQELMKVRQDLLCVLKQWNSTSVGDLRILPEDEDLRGANGQ